MESAEIPKFAKDIFKKRQIEFKQRVEKMKLQPKFPGIEGPRNYQNKAYSNWVSNNYKGLFAMATGTGKTLTALNCLIKEFLETDTQKNIFIVPGEELVRQWAKDLKECNFSDVYLWYGKNKNLKEEQKQIKILKDSKSLNIVITYDSFRSSKFQEIFDYNFNDFTLVFDEVHTLGANQNKINTSKIISNRVIGLSATPLRMWDENNENEFIENLFDSRFPDYTFSFPMEEAIKLGFLCQYEYHPYFVHLDSTELDRYLEFTAKIPKGFNGKMNKTAAMQRQTVLDGAKEKEDKLLEILREISDQKKLQYILIYCPKGENDSGERKIHDLTTKIKKQFKKVELMYFTAETENREGILTQFELGEIDMLLSIKCLDQGINIPRTETGIFLASGKNYREFVQRRGRILRNYNKEGNIKERAYVFDIVVIPTLQQFNLHRETCKKLILAEFKRLFEFSKMAIYNSETYNKIDNELKVFGYNQNYIEYEIEVLKSNNETL